MALHHLFTPYVARAYILHIPCEQSKTLAQRALASCNAVGQSAELWEGFDGTKGAVITPGHLSGQAWLSWIKVYDQRLDPTQIACALGHISLWAQCLTLDQPIVVLEHDAVMLRPYTYHTYPNTISHLGHEPGLGAVWAPCAEQNGMFVNWLFLGGAHAYAIDPLAATRMFAIILKYGIYAPLDFMLRLADVAIIPAEGYARPDPGPSMINSNYGGFDYERYGQERTD